MINQSYGSQRLLMAPPALFATSFFPVAAARLAQAKPLVAATFRSRHRNEATATASPRVRAGPPCAA